MSAARWRLHERSTGVLRAMDRSLDLLPDNVMGELRAAVKLELLARELADAADRLGAFVCVAPRGLQ